MAGPTVRLDLRAVLPVAALVAVVLVIIFVELCGREELGPMAQGPSRATATPISPGPSPTPAPAAATATQEALLAGAERDLTRRQDLAAIQQALERYRQERGRYPDTGGNIQTLCAFADVDAGCDLEETLSPLPQDPLGNPGTNGYWYAATGARYTIYARRESERLPACPEHPDHLREIASLLCVQGP